MPKTCTVHRKAIILHPLLDKHQKFRGVAQLVAHLVWDQDVAGSSPVAPTYNINPQSLRLGIIIGCGFWFQSEMLSMRSFIMPAGTRTSTVSPTFLFSSAWAIGDLMDILPSRRLASLGLAMV